MVGHGEPQRSSRVAGCSGIPLHRTGDKFKGGRSLFIAFKSPWRYCPWSVPHRTQEKAPRLPQYMNTSSHFSGMGCPA